MRRNPARPIVTALSAAAVLALFSAPAAGQVQLEGGGVAMVALERHKAKTSGPTPRTADGKPDLSGLWGPDSNFMGDISRALKPGEKLPLQPWALKLTKERLSKDDPNANCLPSGVPRMAPYPWKIIQTPKLIVFLYEGNMHTYRQVFMDGSSHPSDLDPTWYGDSRGKWEGDTLVVDTVGFNDRFWFDGAGHPHTEKLHIVERFRRPDSAHLDFEVTIDDPGAYTKSFTLFGHSPQMVNTEIMEYFCVENNQDASHLVGKGIVGRGE
jgi:hypothetical protein